MTGNKKRTSQEVAHLASTILNNPNASEIEKKLAGSALAQTGNNKQTGAEMEDIASHVLHSNYYSKEAKELAASVLSQSVKGR